MPKDVAKLITMLDELYRKIEYTLEEHQLDGEDILDNINSATDSLPDLDRDWETIHLTW